LILLRPPRPTLFPYTTLFRSPTEQAIVNATGVSRTVVREALASLRARGLITTRQGLGAFVAETVPARSFAIDAEKLESIGDVLQDRKSTRLNSSHDQISYAVF